MNATVSSKQLGRLLKAMREAAGLTVRAVAEEMAYSAAKVSRQETGVHPISPAELSHLVIRIYGGDEDTLGKLEYYRQRSTQGKGWWAETGARLSDHFEAYLGLEADATHVRVFGLDIVPGLLQTAGYAGAQHNLSGRLTQEEVEHHVRIRMKRQERLHDPVRPLRVTAVISEGALRRCGVHPDCDQLPGLLERAQLLTVSIHVLPFSTGIHDRAGQFVVLTLPEGLLPPVGHQETAVGGHIIEDDAVVTRMIHEFDALRSQALDERSSLAVIEGLIPKG